MGGADAASASPPPQPHGSLVHAHVNCSRWRVVWHLSCVQLPKLDMLLRAAFTETAASTESDHHPASRAVARGGCRRRAAAADRGNKPAATLRDAGREAAHAGDAARPSGSRAEVLCQKRERHLRNGTPWLASPAGAQEEMWERRSARRVVAPREARACQTRVESVGDELLQGRARVWGEIKRLRLRA